MNDPVTEDDLLEQLKKLAAPLERGASPGELGRFIGTVGKASFKRRVGRWLQQHHNQTEQLDEMRNCLATLARCCRLQMSSGKHDNQWVKSGSGGLAVGAMLLAGTVVVTGGASLIAAPFLLGGGLVIGAIGYTGSRRIERQTALYSELEDIFQELEKLTEVNSYD